MAIVIKERFRPFSQVKGVRCLVPGSTYMVEVFPARVRLYDLRGDEAKLIREEAIDVEGPVEGFTVFQDLEKGCVSVRGEGLCYHVLPTGELLFKKKPPGETGERERLFLGVHKKQLWEAISARMDFAEIFPLWHYLAGTLPSLGPFEREYGFFEEIKRSPPEQVLKAFKRFFLANFGAMLVPRLKDDDLQGIKYEQLTNVSPLHLLCEGARLIRHLFIQESSEGLAILPKLPPEFHAGRMVNIATRFGKVHLEWSKKSIRRVVVEAACDGEIAFSFRSEVKGCRGMEGKVLAIKSGEVYLLDRFTK